MYENLALIAIIVLVYSTIAGGLDKTPINGALVFAVLGIALGPLGVGLLDIDVSAEGMRLLAELTLALVLYADAASSDLGVLRRGRHIPMRLLLVGLPLTIALGGLVGLVFFPALGVLGALILSTMLAPTDAALGKAVVTNETVPARTRESLNAESGLNDGLCVPVLFVFLALLAGESEGQSPAGLAVHFLVEEVGIGALVGVATTLAALGLSSLGKGRGWVTETWRQVAVPAAAVSCFATAQSVGGSGFIAAFVGGLLFGALAKDEKHQLLVRAEGSADTLALVTWVVFGAGVVGQAWDSFTPVVVLYAVLSLTVIRMAPVFLSLGGLGLAAPEKLFIGWFGPRGLASIVFIVIVLGETVPGAEIMAAVVVCTVVLSIVAHGLSANPLAAAFGRQASHEPPA